MKKLVVIFGLLGIVSLLCSVSFAATEVILTNDDNPSGNTATAFTVGKAGALTVYKKLTTGYDGLGGGYFAWQGTAVASNASCVFVANTASDNISAFSKSTGYKEVGSYGITGMFSTYGLGGSINLIANGKLLASGDSGLENIAIWSVGKTCALTLLKEYVPTGGADYFSPLGFTPKGTYLVVPIPDLEEAELYSVGKTGALTDIGYVDFYSSLTECQSYGCYPTGLDFTNDEKLVLFGNATLGSETGDSYLLSASITSTGLTNPADTVVTNSVGAINDNVPHLTKTARGGSGDLILGESGYDGYGPSGLGCANFTESPFSVSVVNAVVVTNADEYQGAVVTFGTEGFAAEYPNVIQSFSIGSGCSITLGTATTDPNGYGLLSITAFPANQ